MTELAETLPTTDLILVSLFKLIVYLTLKTFLWIPRGMVGYFGGKFWHVYKKKEIGD
jgi:hypothetical protein